MWELLNCGHWGLQSLILQEGFLLKNDKRCIRDSPYLGQGGAMAPLAPPGSATVHIYFLLFYILLFGSYRGLLNSWKVCLSVCLSNSVANPGKYSMRRAGGGWGTHPSRSEKGVTNFSICSHEAQKILPNVSRGGSRVSQARQPQRGVNLSFGQYYQKLHLWNAQKIWPGVGVHLPRSSNRV